MENFEKIAIGLFVFIITSTLAYLFKMRQLYATAPKLYKNPSISKDGSLCEIIISNKGNQPEEDIKLAFDPSLKIELLAASYTGITTEAATIKVDRLHKNTDASAIVLIEGGDFDHSKIASISSKATSGKICSTPSNVPPNYAQLLLSALLILSIFPLGIYAPKAIRAYNEYTINRDLSSIINLGWSDLDYYHSSDLIKSYSGLEFPLRLISLETLPSKQGKFIFEIYNKTALPLSISIDTRDIKSKELNDIFDYWENITTPPMSKKEFTIKTPANRDISKDGLPFVLKSGKDIYINATLRPGNHEDPRNLIN